MSYHNHVKPFDASCWPKICGGKKVKWPFMFKKTQHHTKTWEAGMLLLQCFIFPVIDVLPPGYGRICNIFSNDK
jgi:hypothetical protein